MKSFSGLIALCIPCICLAQMQGPAFEPAAEIIQRAPVPEAAWHDPGCDHPKDIMENGHYVRKCPTLNPVEEANGWTWYQRSKYREEACGSKELSPAEPQFYGKEGFVAYRCPPLILKTRKGQVLYARPEEAKKHCQSWGRFIWNNQGMFGC
jgi:hypothetical protein